MNRSGKQHYIIAEEWIETAQNNQEDDTQTRHEVDFCLGMAQVHATLAQAANGTELWLRPPNS